MPINATRIMAGAAALAVFLFWLYAALLPWRAERLAQQVASGKIPVTAVPALPGADAAPRIALERMLLQGPLDPEIAAEYFERSLKARPLYAPTWLLGAELALRSGDTATAATRAATAARLWPTRPEFQWRVAMFQVRAGDTDAAMSALRAYLSAEPKGVTRAAAVARRLVQDRDALVAALLPREQNAGDRAVLLRGLVHFARQTRDVALADAIWSAAPQARSDAALVFPYIDLMIAAGERERAQRAWQAMGGHTVALGRISNGGFETPPANGGLGWRLVRLDGVQAAVGREYAYGGSHALELRFDGSANLDYAHAYQVVPVEGGRAYRLTAWWRGEEVTTRSGVFVELVSDGERRAAVHSEARYGSWEWQPVTATVRTPDDARFLTVRVRRARTDALDRLISGRVWFDDFSLERIDAPVANAPDMRRRAPLVPRAPSLVPGAGLQASHG